ncbi:MAG: hypothetical protein ABI720_02695, partial [Actinomycetes bacterium]
RRGSQGGPKARLQVRVTGSPAAARLQATEHVGGTHGDLSQARSRPGRRIALLARQNHFSSLVWPGEPM